MRGEIHETGPVGLVPFMLGNARRRLGKVFCKILG